MDVYDDVAALRSRLSADVAALKQMCACDHPVPVQALGREIWTQGLMLAVVAYGIPEQENERARIIASVLDGVVRGALREAE